MTFSAFWRAGQYPEADRRAMLELLRDHGYRAGQRMGDKRWSAELQRAGYSDGMVVSSFALYLIAVGGAPQSVIRLSEYQSGRLVASHAAPFDASFRLHANVAVGGNFFKHNLAGGAGGAKPDLPFGEDPKVAGLDGIQFLRNRAGWLPSWLEDPHEMSRATFDEASATVVTPRLGKHTRFTIHSVSHVAEGPEL